MKERTSTAMLKKDKFGYVTDKTFLGSFWIYVYVILLEIWSKETVCFVLFIAIINFIVYKQILKVLFTTQENTYDKPVKIQIVYIILNGKEPEIKHAMNRIVMGPQMICPFILSKIL